jgi:type I restriction enzyme S subunit
LKVYRLKHVVSNPVVKASVDGTGRIDMEDIGSGAGVLLTPEEERSSRTGEGVVFDAGDILFGKLRPYLRKSLLCSGHGLCSPELLVLRPDPSRLEPRFLHYVVRSAPFVAWAQATSKGTKMPRTDFESLGQYHVELPSLDEQRRIAGLLDAAVERLDAMAGTLARVAELATNRFETQVQTAVLGREPDAPLLSAASDPFRWFRRAARNDLCPRPLKFVLNRNDSGVWGEDPVDGDGDAIVLRSTEISRDGSWRMDDPARRTLTEAEWLRAALKCGDVVVVTSSGSVAHLGKAAIVDESIEELGACFSNFLQRLRCDRRTSSRFVWYLLNSSAARAQMAWLGSTTTGLRNLNGAILGSVLHPGMGLTEQASVAEMLDVKRAGLEDLRARIEQQERLLAEHRDALITAAVTGELDPSSCRASAVAT